MRRLFWAGLTLALGCAAASSWAEEIQFRPAGQPAAAGHPAFDPAVVPTSFSPDTTSPIFRAKTEDTKTLPDGPPLPSDVPSVPVGEGKGDPQKPAPKPEEMPLPKPLPSGGGAGANPSGPTAVVPGLPVTIVPGVPAMAMPGGPGAYYE